MTRVPWAHLFAVIAGPPHDLAGKRAAVIRSRPARPRFEELPAAEAVEIDSDERGWLLVVRDDFGDVRSYRLPHDVALELDTALAPVREHEAEGRAVLRDFRAGIDPPATDDVGDPDHPDPEALRAAGDLERKRRREQR